MTKPHCLKINLQLKTQHHRRLYSLQKDKTYSTIVVLKRFLTPLWPHSDNKLTKVFFYYLLASSRREKEREYRNTRKLRQLDDYRWHILVRKRCADRGLEFFPGSNMLLLLEARKLSSCIFVARVLRTSYHIYPTPPLGQDMTQGQFLSGV